MKFLVLLFWHNMLCH